MRVFLIFLALFASLMAKDEFFGGEKKGKKEVAPVSNELYKKRMRQLSLRLSAWAAAKG